jgi:hypothetical protein
MLLINFRENLKTLIKSTYKGNGGKNDNLFDEKNKFDEIKS